MFLPSCSGRLLLKELEMPPAHIPAALLAVAFWAGWVLVATALAADGPAAKNGDAIGLPPPSAAAQQSPVSTKPLQEKADWLSSVAAAARRVEALVEAGHARAPALALALGAVVVLPAIAAGSWLLIGLSRRKAAAAAIRAAELRAANAEATTQLPENESTSLWPHAAWLRLEGTADESSLPLAGQLIRIGRHLDNDIRLPDSSVHRHHAVIERTPEEAFVITDVSGQDGNGIRVNGRRQERVRLSDGDLIEVGHIRMRFERVPV